MAIIEELKEAFPSTFMCVVEDCAKIKATELAQTLKAPIGVSAWRITFKTADETFTQDILLKALPLPCGQGNRFYILCGCHTKCHKLYLPPGQRHFACRKCHHLHYKAQRFRRYL